MNLDLSSVQVIFFDAAGTLFHVRGSVGGIYSRVAWKYGVKSEPAEVERAFVQAFHAKSAEGITPVPAGGRSQAEKHWWLEVVRQVFASSMPEPVLQAYFDEVFEVFRRADAYLLFPETPTVLERLRRLGYRLGILSNFDSRLHDVLRGLGIESFFDTVVLSWDAGFAKPDARLFQHALQEAGIPAALALHVGDSLSEDFQGAAAAGMRGLLLDRKNAWPSLTNVPRIANLLEIPEMMRFSENRVKR